MKITFDGIIIEDASPKEIVAMVAALRGKRVSSTKAGVYKLPKSVRGANADVSKFDNPWTEKEIIFLLKNMDKKPKELVKSPELSSRGKPAISARMSAIRSGDKARMGAMVYKIGTELGIIES